MKAILASLGAIASGLDHVELLTEGLHLPAHTRLRACKHGVMAFPENDGGAGLVAPSRDAGFKRLRRAQ